MQTMMSRTPLGRMARTPLVPLVLCWLALVSGAAAANATQKLVPVATPLKTAGTPGTPGTPGTLDTPDTPNTPGTPDTPDTPDTPGTPGNPGNPDTPDTPDTPGTPDTAETPGTPDTPGTPGTNDTREADVSIGARSDSFMSNWTNSNYKQTDKTSVATTCTNGVCTNCVNGICTTSNSNDAKPSTSIVSTTCVNGICTTSNSNDAKPSTSTVFTTCVNGLCTIYNSSDPCQGGVQFISLASGQTSTIKSPGFPKKFNSYTTCRYKFQATNSSDRLFFNCPTLKRSWLSYVTYTNNGRWKGDQSCGFFCWGKSDPFSVTLGGNSSEMWFSNSIHSSGGFNCSMTAVPRNCKRSPASCPDSDTCSRNTPEVTLARGQTYWFTSPKYPDYFSWWWSCRYQFKTADPKDRIVLECVNLSLSSVSGMSWTNDGKEERKDCYLFNWGEYAFNATTLKSGKTEIWTWTSWSETGGYNCSVKSSVAPKCVCGNYPTTRIVGGTDVSALKYGWMAALVKKGEKEPFCAGSLISSKWILTAAHCVKGETASALQVRLGVTDWGVSPSTEVKRDVVKIIENPKYTATPRTYDVALLQVAAIDLVDQKTIVPLCLASGTDTYENKEAYLTGWGATTIGANKPNSKKLKEAKMTVISEAACKKVYKTPTGADLITDQMICTLTKDTGTCKGDAGGPLFLKTNTTATAIGVASWDTCALANKPGVYTEITAVRNWIDANVDEKCYPSTS